MTPAGSCNGWCYPLESSTSCTAVQVIVLACIHLLLLLPLPFDILQRDLQRQSLINIPRKKNQTRERRKEKRKKDTSLRRLTPFCAHFQLVIDLPHLLSLFHPSFLLHTPSLSILNSYSASTLHPHAMGMGLSSPPP